MTRFLVTGGRQRAGARGETEWFSYREALAFAVDTDACTVTPAISWLSRPEHRPDDERANIVFKAGTRDGDLVHICTQTEIVTYRLPDFTFEGCLSHPWFNDLHHVVVNAAGNFLVAVTGLDLVVEMTRDGDVVNEWPVIDGNTWQRFDRDTDYRRVITTKPHQAHPNYVFEWDGQVWCTRLYQKDAVCLTDPGRGVESQHEKLHDGVVRDDKLHLTSVDGHFIVGDLPTGRTAAKHDLNRINESGRILGWCRGIHLLEDERVIIGFSRIRPSKIRENVAWIKYRMGLREDAGRAPTRIACYDLAAQELEWEIPLEPHGLNAVFSIIPLD